MRKSGGWGQVLPGYEPGTKGKKACGYFVVMRSFGTRNLFKRSRWDQVQGIYLDDLIPIS